jgi:hypothetical protein
MVWQVLMHCNPSSLGTLMVAQLVEALPYKLEGHGFNS